MILCEIPVLTDPSDHGMIVYFSHWLTWLIGSILAFIGVVIYGEYKIWQEVKKSHIEKNSKEAIKKEERISKAVETITEFKASIDKIEENYESTKRAWTNIESDYRHIKKALETFNNNTPKIQDGLVELMNELKAEVKKVEEIKMTN